jgi:tryptophan synthase alpha chain
MNRIDTTLMRLRTSGKKMLSPYITAGDPNPSITVKLMHELVNAGADILELGIPFSDPMAEGPVIQRAMERALTQQVNCHTVLAMVKEFRVQDKETPVILMGYLNPIEYFGYELFAQEAKKVGVDGTILVDLPPEESEEIAQIWEKQGLYHIFLCSPTTSDERMKLINQYAKGYLYYVSLKGVTGGIAPKITSLKKEYQQRKMQTPLPLMIGFGIKTANMAAEVASFADGVIVGAALITQILDAYNENHDMLQAAKSLISSMRQAMDKI